MVLNCQGNLHIFPFDNLKCPFALESVSHEETEVELKWSETEQRINGATSLRQQNAYLVKNVTGPCETQHTWRGNMLPDLKLENHSKTCDFLKTSSLRASRIISTISTAVFPNRKQNFTSTLSSL
ncbi:glutamate-gated chloride channel [Trichonephila clavipes]|nr:glutamate-gated chloride channel [Trichonephila clavipes]